LNRNKAALNLLALNICAGQSLLKDRIDLLPLEKEPLLAAVNYKEKGQ